jgi:quercetin dioxygenase-like cupin family protein
MKVQHCQSVESQKVQAEGAHGCTVRWLVGTPDGAPNFAMRQFEVAPGGYTPRHFHPYEHEVFVLEGSGEVMDGDRVHRIAAGDVVFVAPDDVHQFRNTGSRPLKFLCMVPNSAASLPVTLAPECGATAKELRGRT